MVTEAHLIHIGTDQHDSSAVGEWKPIGRGAIRDVIGQEAAALIAHDDDGFVLVYGVSDGDALGRIIAIAVLDGVG